MRTYLAELGAGRRRTLDAKKPPRASGSCKSDRKTLRPRIRSEGAPLPNTLARWAIWARQYGQALLAVAVLVGALARVIAFAGVSAHSGGRVGLHLAGFHLAGFHFGIRGPWSDIAFTRRAGSRLRRLGRCDRRRSQ